MNNQSNSLYVLLLISVSLFSGYLYLRVNSLEQKIVLGAATKKIVQAKTVKQPSLFQETLPVNESPQVTDEDNIRGNKNAPVVLIEYSDFECPFCKRFHPTMQKLIKEYGDKVAWVYRHYPLSFHANAQKEAEATECANELGGAIKFWEYTDKLFDRTLSGGTGFPLEQLVPLATELGLNTDAFKTCLDTGRFATKVKEEMSNGTKIGVTGTPGTVVLRSGKKPTLIPGALPYDQIKQIVDNALQ